MTLSQSQSNALYFTAAKLSVTNPTDLADLINFESGWNPLAKNPQSSARGLIQFMDATAKDLGYSSSLDLVQKNPAIEDQLEGPVYQYLKRYAPYGTDRHKLFMAVIYPAAAKYPSSTPFKTIFTDRFGLVDGALKYAEFIDKNPGIVTPAAYAEKVTVAAKGGSSGNIAAAGTGIFGIGLICGLIALFFRRK